MEVMQAFRKDKPLQPGYMLFKRFNRWISKTSPGVASRSRPSIIFRLADFYLIYAEVANEVKSERLSAY